MSRIILFENEKLVLITGIDHIMGQFFQLYDKEMKYETPEGEGLVLDWSEFFGFETNFTGINNNFGSAKEICDQYIIDYS